MDAKKIGLKIKAARMELGLNQYETAYTCIINYSMITRYEGGQAIPSLITLEKLCYGLNKSLSYFLDDQECFHYNQKKETQR